MKYKVSCLAICSHGKVYRAGQVLEAHHIDNVKKRLKSKAIVEYDPEAEKAEAEKAEAEKKSKSKK